MGVEITVPAAVARQGRPGRAAFPAGLLPGLLPAQVSAVDAFDDCFDGPRLLDPPAHGREVAFGAELDALGDAPAGRRQEFARARVCAHAAVAALGRRPEPIGLGPHREPRWPAGLVGSITHCAGYRAAAVARGVDVLALGIDAEPDRPLPAEVARLAFTDADRALSGRLDRFRNWDTVAFSARESVFKAWFGVTGHWLHFGDATLALAPDGLLGGGFTATIGGGVAGVRELLRTSGSAVIRGRFRRVARRARGPDLVLTAVAVGQRIDGAAPAPSPTVEAGAEPVCHTDELPG